MTKLSVTYRASIDRSVPISVRRDIPEWMGGAKKSVRNQTLRQLFSRPRLRVTS